MAVRRCADGKCLPSPQNQCPTRICGTPLENGFVAICSSAFHAHATHIEIPFCCHSWPILHFENAHLFINEIRLCYATCSLRNNVLKHGFKMHIILFDMEWMERPNARGRNWNCKIFMCVYVCVYVCRSLVAYTLELSIMCYQKTERMNIGRLMHRTQLKSHRFFSFGAVCFYFLCSAYAYKKKASLFHS